MNTINRGDLFKLQNLLDSSPSGLLTSTPLSSISPEFERAHCGSIHQLLDIASSLPSADVVRLLINHEVDTISSPEERYSSALLNAIQNDRPMNVDALLSARANAKGIAGDHSPLQQAVSSLASPSIFQMLLDHGADVDTVCIQDGIEQSIFQTFLNKRSSPLRPQKKHGYIERVLKILLEYRADILTADINGRWPFDAFLDHWRSKAEWFSAMTPEERSCLALFLSKGARLRTPFQSPLCPQDTPTFEHVILCHTNLDTISLLIDHADMRSGGNGSDILNELLKSCPGRNIPSELTTGIIEKTLEKGTDPNGLCDEGHSPLTNLLGLGKGLQIDDYMDCLNLLLSNGADPRMADDKGQYPLAFVIHTFDTQDPVRLQLAETLLSKYTRQSGDWTEPYFPITPNWPDYAEGSDFWNDVHANQSEDVSTFFAKTALSVSTKMFLDQETSVTPSPMSNSEILEALKIRKAAELPDYEIPQDYTVRLLEMFKSNFPSTLTANGSLIGPVRQPAALSLLATNKSLALPDASGRMEEQFWLSAAVPATLLQNPLRPPPDLIQSGIFQEIDQAYMCPICPQFPGVILEGWQYR